MKMFWSFLMLIICLVSSRSLPACIPDAAKQELQREKALLTERLERNNLVIAYAKHELKEIRHQLEVDCNSSANQLQEKETEIAAASATIAKLRTELETRVRDKNKEIGTIRESNALVVEDLQTSLNKTETRLQTEITSIKEKYEDAITELEKNLYNVKKYKYEYENVIIDLRKDIKELEHHLEKERRQTNDLRDQVMFSERVNLALQAKVDEAIHSAETSLRDNRNAKNKLSGAESKETDLTSKEHRYEGNVTALRSELERSLNAERATNQTAATLVHENKRLLFALHQLQQQHKTIEKKLDGANDLVSELKKLLDYDEEDDVGFMHSVEDKLGDDGTVQSDMEMAANESGLGDDHTSSE